MSFSQSSVGTEKSDNKVISNAWEEPSMATDSVKSASSDKSKNGEGGDWTYNDAKRTMLEALKFGIERASVAYEQAKNIVIDLVTNNEVLDKAYDVEDYDDDLSYKKAKGNYDEAKQNEKDSYRLAKEKMSEEQKDTYEAAKENASQAAADLGEALRLREKREEL